MIPLRDSIPSRTTPWVNYTLIALCGLAFLVQLRQQTARRDLLVERFGMVPRRTLHPEEPILHPATASASQIRLLGPTEPLRMAEPPFPPWLTLLTCIFLHGGWMHFLGNMWFLFIFGDNVEDRMGHVGFLLFYLVCGVSASVAHLLTNPDSTIPTIGASGAIAGVMGAYLLLYPRANVLSLIPIFFFIEIVVLPAPVFLGIWFLIQFLQGTMAITAMRTAGVAWWAHIGGFAFGYLIAAGLRAVGETRPPVEQMRPNADRVRLYRYHR